VIICRDVKDNHILDLAKISKAQYIITGDEDLLTLKTFQTTKILKFNSFIENHYK